jgi:hypothetical protein
VAPVAIWGLFAAVLAVTANGSVERKVGALVCFALLGLVLFLNSRARKQRRRRDP